MRLVAWWTSLSALSLMTGCFTSSYSLVASRFEALHDCPAEQVSATPGGYVATGCGLRAHFSCFDTDDDDDLLLLGDDVCIQEQVTSTGELFAGEQFVAARDPTVVSRGRDGSVRLRAWVPLTDAPRGELSVVGAPTWKERTVAMRVALELEQPLPDPCAVRLFVDGDEIAVHRERESDNAVRIAMTSAQLAQLGRAEGVVLVVGGHVVDLKRALPHLRLFASRFAETRMRLVPVAAAEAAAGARR